MSFFENTRKPVGLGGKIMVAMMNLGHSPVAQWGLLFLNRTALFQAGNFVLQDFMSLPVQFKASG